MRTPKLTDAQARVLKKLRKHCRGEVTGPEYEVNPREIWPARTAQASASRRVCKSLQKKGLLHHHRDVPERQIAYEITQEAWDALHSYVQAQGEALEPLETETPHAPDGDDPLPF